MRSVATKPLDLSRYTTSRVVSVGNREWKAIREAQDRKLVSVRAISPDLARVQITEAGAMALALGAVE